MTLSYPETHELTERIIGCAIEVHRHLGPGLLESVYEQCLFWELQDAKLAIQRQVPIPIRYKGHVADGLFRPDLIINRLVVVEVKSVEKILPVHEAQLLTYLKLTEVRVGLLLNFNTPVIRQGLKRISH